MKTLTILFSLSLLLLGSGCSNSQGNGTQKTPLAEAENTSFQKAVKRYGYESGMVKYKTKGSQETLYFDNWGALEARYVVYPKGMEMDNTITIMNEQGIFTYYPNKGTGVRLEVPPGMHMAQQDLAVGESDESGTVTRLPDEDILSYPCVVYEMNKMMKAWTHKGITLKWEQQMGPMLMKTKAISFEPDASIDPAKFQFPDGVDPSTFPDAEEVLEQMKNQ